MRNLNLRQPHYPKSSNLARIRTQVSLILKYYLLSYVSSSELFSLQNYCFPFQIVSTLSHVTIHRYKFLIYF